MVTPSVLKKGQKKRRHPNEMPKHFVWLTPLSKGSMNPEVIYSAVGVLSLYKANDMPDLFSRLF
jgi:hypothetical protein